MNGIHGWRQNRQNGQGVGALNPVSGTPDHLRSSTVVPFSPSSGPDDEEPFGSHQVSVAGSTSRHMESSLET